MKCTQELLELFLNKYNSNPKSYKKLGDYIINGNTIKVYYSYYYDGEFDSSGSIELDILEYITFVFNLNVVK